jgi:hypothetical protein
MKNSKYLAIGVAALGLIALPLAAQTDTQTPRTTSNQPAFEERIVVTIPVPPEGRTSEEFHIMRSDFPPNVDDLQGVVVSSAGGTLVVRTTVDGYETLRLTRLNDDPTRFREGMNVELNVENVATGTTAATTTRGAAPTTTARSSVTTTTAPDREPVRQGSGPAPTFEGETAERYDGDAGLDSAATRRTTLPQTASDRHLFGLAGLVALAASLGVAALGRKLA